MPSDVVRRIVLGGASVDLLKQNEVLAAVRARLERVDNAVPPLAISSVNLDHIHHFGTDGKSRMDTQPNGTSPDWLALLDGVPLVRRAASLTGTSWPQLAGSDLLPALLALAESAGARVGFFGGTPAMHDELLRVLARRYPRLAVASTWSPARTEVTDPTRSAALAESVRAADVELLVVGLGKPLQEQWIQKNARTTGARVLLAFGASADFLAGTATRAPAWMRDAGLEWFFRLVREPRRLGRRYCLEAPRALRRLRTDSTIPDPDQDGGRPWPTAALS